MRRRPRSSAGVRRPSLLIGLLALAVGCLLPGAALAAGPDDVQTLENEGVREIIVARDPGLSAAARGDLRAAAGVTHVENLPLPDTEVVRAPAGGLIEAVDALQAEPGVRYVEPNGPVHAASADPDWPDLWALQNDGVNGGINGTPGADISASQAWGLSIGTGQVIGVVDTGVLATHEDLQGGALWTNPGEAGARATNGVDDDQDGAVDDFRGWNALTKTTDVADGEGHGTHVTGTLVARKDNGVGIAGVAPGASAFPLAALDATGTGTDASIAAAFDVAGNLRLRVVNASVEQDPVAGPPLTVENAIKAHPNTLYVLAAGNAGNDDDDPAKASYCQLPEDNIVCVGASDPNDARAIFPAGGSSNFGAANVDLFAPGLSIASAALDPVCVALNPRPPANGCYAFLDGTSMAAPHVSATLALMLARNPALTAAQLKAILLGSVDRHTGLPSVTGGRLNAFAAVARTPLPSAPAPPPPPAPAPAPAAAAAAPAPAATPAAVAPVAPVTTAAALAPVLGRPALSGATLTAKRPVTLRFTLDRAATVKLTVLRGSRTAATATIHGRKGANRYVVRTKIGARRLARGRYRVKLQVKAGTAASKSYTLAVTVR